jgi:YfiH family protein
MDPELNLIQYKIFQPFKNLVAFTTTKQTFSSQNTRFTGDSNEIFESNRRELSQKLEIGYGQLIFPRQTHSSCVAEIKTIPESEISETDALVTNQKGICLCVQTADCVPILLFDPEKNVVAAVHAGWRGTVKKIVELAVRKMISVYDSNPGNILAAVGPSISPGVYEVGIEVAGSVKKTIPNSDLTLQKNNAGKYFFNLWEANRQLLLKAGISESNIEILGECSFMNDERYYSARREGIDTGRMVSGIMLG